MGKEETKCWNKQINNIETRLVRRAKLVNQTIEDTRPPPDMMEKRLEVFE